MSISRKIGAAAFGAALAAALAGPASAQTRIVMAGSSSGGTAHLYFAALAPLLNKYVPGMEASARSGGSTENVVLLERGTAQIAGASPGDAEKVLGKSRAGAIAQLIVKPQGKPVIVPQDDKRAPLGAEVEDFSYFK